MPARAARFQQAAVLAALAVAPESVPAQEVVDGRVRYEMPRAIVIFENGQFSPAEMGRFAVLADRGVTDIDLLLNGPTARPVSLAAAPPPRILFVVSASQRMSQTFRRRVMLPAERVHNDSAPYLHETTHALMPTRSECLWLSEGFASYVQSYVAEHIGGYDGVVFSRGGNTNVDRLARRHFRSPFGDAALPYVGGLGEPPDLFENRHQVAEPLYVMAHSFVKYLVEHTSLDDVRRLALSSDVPAAAERLTGRTIESWKAEWVARVMSPTAIAN